MRNKLQRRNILAVVIPAVVVLLTAITVVAVQSKSSVTAPAPTPAGQIQVKGTALCLPHKNTDGPQTMECALGLKAEDGRYYALGVSDQKSDILSTLPMNESLVVTGTFVKGESKIYPTIGTIKVTKVAR